MEGCLWVLGVVFSPCHPWKRVVGDTGLAVGNEGGHCSVSSETGPGPPHGPLPTRGPGGGGSAEPGAGYGRDQESQAGRKRPSSFYRQLPAPASLVVVVATGRPITLWTCGSPCESRSATGVWTLCLQPWAEVTVGRMGFLRRLAGQRLRTCDISQLSS